MNNLKNSVQLIGYLGADPEVKTLEKGAIIANIRIATTEKFKNSQGEWLEDTQWHYCTLWDKMAQRAQNMLQKGSHVLIRGKLIHRNYEDALGVKRYVTEVRVSSFLMLEPKKPELTDPLPGIMPSLALAEHDDLPF